MATRYFDRNEIGVDTRARELEERERMVDERERMLDRRERALILREEALERAEVEKYERQPTVSRSGAMMLSTNRGTRRTILAIPTVTVECGARAQVTIVPPMPVRLIRAHLPREAAGVSVQIVAGLQRLFPDPVPIASLENHEIESRPWIRPGMQVTIEYRNDLLSTLYIRGGWFDVDALVDDVEI